MNGEEISQLTTYERAIEHCSNEGNRAGVEMFGGLIVVVARKKKRKMLKEINDISSKCVMTEIDLKNLETSRNSVVVFDDWIERYSSDGVLYKRVQSVAKSNSWKYGEPPVV